MLTPPLASPYLAPGFYDNAIAQGRHRDIVGGRWEETGRLQLQILRDAGLTPDDHLLDIGAGALRLGCKAVPYLHPGHYWATDASRALMLRGRQVELADPDRLPLDHLIEDASFALPRVPGTITCAIAFAVFTHLPAGALRPALVTLSERCPNLRAFLVTVFLAPDAITAQTPLRQRDGVVTHANRPPYHRLAREVEQDAHAGGFKLTWSDSPLPRGQVLAILRPTNQTI